MRIQLTVALLLASCGRVGFEHPNDIVFRDGDTDFATGDEDGVPDPSGACLETATGVEVVTGHHEDEYAPVLASGLAFDARDATFRIVDVRWGIIDLVGDASATDVCWVGGDVDSSKPWDASWDEHTDLDGPTRNNAAITVRSYDTRVSGMSVFNVLDAFRNNEGLGWTVEHSWAQYIRSDCVENDGLQSGRIHDVLFDGCYTGVSAADASTTDGSGEVIILDRVLMRLEPMPYPSSSVVEIDENGDPYTGSGIPYGNGPLFKYLKSDLGRSPHFVIRNSVFVGTHFTEATDFDFPDDSVIDECSSNTAIWIGDGTWPGQLPDSTAFPDCVTVLSGAAGEAFWRDAVTDWHARHPGVGADRKPSVPGALAFPRVF